MRFTLLPPNTFRKLQVNAGVLATTFDPANPTTPSGIIGATSGGTSFAAAPTYQDFGEGIDNCPKNTMELKRQTEVEVTMSGSFRTVDVNLASMLIAACTTSTAGTATKIVPKLDLSVSDFHNLWLIGDYSDDNSESTGGFIAIKLINALSTGGFQMQTADKDKGTFAFTFTGHFSINNPNVIPYEVYIQDGAVASLTVVSVAGSTTGKTKITVSGYVLGAGESWKYKTATSVTLPDQGDSASSWTTWDGSADITATTGNEIAIAAVDSSDKVVTCGKATVTSHA